MADTPPDDALQEARFVLEAKALTGKGDPFAYETYVATAVEYAPLIAQALIDAREWEKRLREALTDAVSLVHAHTGADDEIANSVIATARAALTGSEGQ